MPGDKSPLLSIAELARKLKLPESTARYYCKRFADFIPSVGQGRRRRFRPETVEVLELVLEQMRRSRTALAVEEVLEQRFARNAQARAASVGASADAGCAAAYPEATAAFVSGNDAGRLAPASGEAAQGKTAHACQSAPAPDSLAQTMPQGQRKLCAKPQFQPVMPQSAYTDGASILPAQALMLIERQTAALELIAELLRLFLAQGTKPKLCDKGEANDDAAKESAREAEQEKLRSEVETLRLLLDASEKTQQADLQQLRDWMTRIIQKGKV